MRPLQSVLTAAASLALAFTLAGCSSDDAAPTTDTEASQVPTGAEEPAAESVSYDELLTATFNGNHDLDDALDEIVAAADDPASLDPQEVVDELNAQAETEGLIFRVDSVDVEAASITCSTAGGLYLYSFETEADFGLYLGDDTAACESADTAEASAQHVLTAVFDEEAGTFSFQAESATDTQEGLALAEKATTLAESMATDG